MINPDVCPKCELSYNDFRTGYTYRDIYIMLWNRKFKRRNGVLGKWREIKLAMFAEHIKQCSGPIDDEQIESWEY